MSNTPVDGEPPAPTPLDVHPVTLAFRDPVLERDYLRAWSRGAIRVLRIALGLLVVANAVVRMLPAPPGALWWRNIPAAFLGVLGLGATYTNVGRRNVRPIALGVTLYGPIGMTVLTHMAPLEIVRHGAPAWVVFTVGTCVLMQLGFLRSALVVAAYSLAFHHAVQFLGIRGDELAVTLFSFHVTNAVCIVATYLSERRDRRLFLDERLLASERTRSEELLETEIRRQVAERSRELGAVLARSDVTLDVRRLAPGERFDERYEIEAPLGAGGMGAVYEVERVTDGAHLALKVVTGEVSSSAAARFAREAEIGARVRHANLVSIIDVGVSSGVPFLVMELVRGGSLEAVRKTRFGDVAWGMRVLAQVAEGLAALHEAGVVHRDLKPGNVLLAGEPAQPVAKISDFGISRFGAIDDGVSVDPNAATMGASPQPRAGAVTGTGVVLGTPLYMAPEAARGGRALDAAADVFALGIIAYELLAGRSPLSVPAYLLALAGEPVPPAPPIADAAISLELRTLLVSALANDPAARPRSRAIAAALAGP